jgi:hypothetical protein
MSKCVVHALKKTPLSMIPEVQYSRNVFTRVYRKLKGVCMYFRYSFAWKEWVRRVELRRVKESQLVEFRQLHSTVICWEVLKERTERSKAFDEFYAEWQHNEEPNIIIC